MNLAWYINRARAMGPREILSRLHDRINQLRWRYAYFDRNAEPPANLIGGVLRFRGGLSRAGARDAPAQAQEKLLSAAEALLQGRWPTFSVSRSDIGRDIDWHLDVKSGARLSASDYSFAIPIYGKGVGFETKYVWELSRHHHTTVLAMAYWLTGDVRYAESATNQIDAWCAGNPFLHGVHWSSGIELGVRLISFAWVRRLLEDWPEVHSCFDDNPKFVECVYQHQWWLTRRLSSGSSANNHLIYEGVGIYVAACSMPWFAESASWRVKARDILEREFRKQTFASGINRELGSGYNAFVFEALALCLIEGQLSDDPWPITAWQLAANILSLFGNFADCKGCPPRQGDGDDAQGLLLDAPGFGQSVDLLQLGAAWFGYTDCLPHLEERPLRSWLWGRTVGPPLEVGRKPRSTRNSLAVDAGLVILRSHSNTSNEIYCVFDAGPLGYLSIAAHGHADALAIELRYGGQSILVDPGTFSYTASEVWRNYFRSTAAHNTLVIGGTNQSESGGPFLWKRAAKARLLGTEGLEESSPVAFAEGEHDGYRLRFGVCHNRRVTLDRARGEIAIEDRITGGPAAPVQQIFHLHPDISCYLTGNVAHLSWIGNDGRRQAKLVLSELMNWQEVCGSNEPVLGWYSPSYDVIVPTITLVGVALINDTVNVYTTINLDVKNQEIGGPGRRGTKSPPDTL
jgi:hypothetical protein